MDTRAIMQQLADAIVAEARARIPGGPTGRAGLVINVESVTPTSCTIVAEPPASYLIRGWPGGPMTWLTGKWVAFTPKGGGKKLIRYAAPRYMGVPHVTKGGYHAKGWIRPARAPQDVLGQAWQSPQAQTLASSLATSLYMGVAATSSGGSFWQTVPSTFNDPLTALGG